MPIDGQPLLTSAISDDLHHVFPQVIADPSGAIICSYYEFGPKQGKNQIDVFVAQSLDNGLTFLPFKVTDQPWDPSINAPWAHHHDNPSQIDSSCTFIGDYFGLDAGAAGIFPCWTDTRDGQQELYTEHRPGTALRVLHRTQHVGSGRNRRAPKSSRWRSRARRISRRGRWIHGRAAWRVEFNQQD
jgi:hypothetical protein